MAEVTGKTSEEIDELFGEMVVSGRAQSGNLILVKQNGEEILGGYIGGGSSTPVDPGPGEDALSYENAAPNTIFAIFRDASTGDWPGQRPSARSDIYFDVTGVEPSPSWLLDKDRRSYPRPEGGMSILAEDLEMDFSGGTGYDGQTYETALPGSIFGIYKDPATGWPSARPSNRTDIFFELIGTGALPSWVINKDRRGMPKS